MKIIEIKKKVPKFLILPLIVLLILSIYSGLDKYQEKEQLVVLKGYIVFSKLATDLIHELQKERGLSSGFLASGGKSFTDELNKQRDLTDIKIQLLNKHLDSEEYEKCKFPFEKPTKELLEPLKDIGKFRANIDKLLVSDVIDYYTNYINILLKHINMIIALANDGEHAILVESYIAIMDIKEKAGIERALINKIFGLGHLSNYELYKFGELVAAQEIYLKHFKRIAKKEHIEMFNTKEVEDSFKEVEEDRNIIYEKTDKNSVLTEIKELIGYGGLIHNFKNYVIRGEDKYAQNFQKQYSELEIIINKYKAFKGITVEEIQQLEIIQNLFAQYFNGMQMAMEAYAKGTTALAIDKLIKLNDYPAIDAFNHLKTNIYGSQQNWFKHSTHKINLLKKIENKIVSDLMVFTDERKIELFIQLVIQILILIIILLIIISSFIVLKQLLDSRKMLSRAQKNTKSGSFEYYVEENIIFWSDEQYKLLQVDKNTFNLTIESFMEFVHPDDLQIFKDNLELSIKSKKITFFEYRIVLPDKTVIHVRSSSEVTKYTSSGKPLVIVGTITDISDSKKLEQEIIDTQKDVIFTMGAIGESRSRETGQHVKRVAEYSKLLYLSSGATEEEAELLRMASPMHDIGKIGIPDSILNKPGKLTPEEWEIMQTHAELGYDMLKSSNRDILKLAATVALTHHEKYDGGGYPKGLVGENIPLVGRITALADVFDALGSERCYKKAWELEEILEYIKLKRGTQFDPKLVDHFLKNLYKFLEIRDKYKDII
ncbi:MAG: nitrate- and nitrite sensing domain-containing protein [Sulfurimonas sp.]|nr:nitrate- and nitrite sensing domain-containing protein [Sulfurimonas sp.]